MTTRVRRAGERSVLRLSDSERLASLAYGVALPDLFGREHRAVLAGRRRFTEQHTALEHRYTLRRNVHMIEKGLSMRPRRPVFAAEYIGTTVVLFAALAAEAGCDTDRELQWANDVLSEYFDAVGDHPAIDAARATFVRSPLGSDTRATKAGLAPYARDLSGPPSVAFADLRALAERRRSVRWFDERPVPRRLVEEAIEVAALSPSACNRQPYQFRAFDDPELLARVAAVPMGTRGWVQNIPLFIVVVGDLSAFFSERDRHLIYTDASLAIMSLLFALEAQGLSSCCVNWPDIAEREAKMAHLLALEAHERPVMCVAAGYADPSGLVPFSHKKPSRDLLRWNDD